MLLYINSQFTISRLSSYISSPYIKRYKIQGLFIIVLMLSFFTVNSQENNYQTSIASTEIEKKVTSTENIQQYKTLFKTGNSYYKNKLYNAAIEQYSQSLNYLSGNDKATQKLFSATYTKIAESYKRIKNRDKSVYFYKKSLDIFTHLNNKKEMARTLKNLAEMERHLGNLVMALNYSTQSLKIHETINEPKEQAKALMAAGIIYRHIGRYEQSIKHIKKAYLYYKETENYNGVAKTSNEIGNIYIRLKQFEQAKYFFQETINIPEDKLELKTLASAFKGMGVIELDNTDYQSAMDYAQKALKIYQVENEQLNVSVTARILANIYRAQGDRTNAIYNYQKSATIAIENNSEKQQIEAQLPLAELFIVEDVNKAIDLLISSLKIAIRIKDDKQIYHAYHKLSLAEEYQGNFEQALIYTRQGIERATIMQKKADDKKINLAKAALYSHKMEIELASLREKTRLDQLELAKKNNEIEIGKQARTIHELESIKNQYSSLALTFLLVICVFLVIFIYRRFIASKKRNKELKYLASRDPLTNCYNRRSLFELMNKYLRDTEVDEDYCILMVDIDHFKNVNDTYGHSTGDSVLRGFAAILKSCVRQNDIVARFGGEEFCVVLHKVSQTKVMDIAENMRSKIENSDFDGVTITSSFGVTSLQFGADSPTELIEQADIALYKSKSLGRNKVTLWDESFKAKDNRL